MVKHQDGFSLVELLVSIVIVSILAAIVIPGYIGLKNRANDTSIIANASNASKELLLWMHVSNSPQKNLIEVDTNFNGILDALDKTNSQLLSDGVANTYVTNRTAVLQERSPWYNTPLWSLDTTIPNGRITLIQTSISHIRIVGKDYRGAILFDRTVRAD